MPREYISQALFYFIFVDVLSKYEAQDNLALPYLVITLLFLI